MEERNTKENIAGCLIGGAVGDALGAPVTFMKSSKIFSRFGSGGITEYVLVNGKKGAITDSTLLSLFTAEGLVLSKVRHHAIDPMQAPVFVYHAYLRWLSTQQEVDGNELLRQYGSCSLIDGVLIGYPKLQAKKSLESVCIESLKSSKMGSTRDMINNSKQYGGIMRVAPVGLFFKTEHVFTVACEIAAITHGHPTGYLSAGCLAQLINGLFQGYDLVEAIEKMMVIVLTKRGHEKCLSAIQNMVKVWKNAPVSVESVEMLGKGWNAEEALAIGIYCALAAGDNFEKGIHLAVNHSGNSRITGSITGNILGLMHGVSSIPSHYLSGLELIDAAAEISDDLFEQIRQD